MDPSLQNVDRQERIDNVESTKSTDYFRPGMAVRVTRGSYEGALGTFLGPRVGGDVAICIIDAHGYDLHEGETLCVGDDQIAKELSLS